MTAEYPDLIRASLISLYLSTSNLLPRLFLDTRHMKLTIYSCITSSDVLNCNRIFIWVPFTRILPSEEEADYGYAKTSGSGHAKTGSIP